MKFVVVMIAALSMSASLKGQSSMDISASERTALIDLYDSTGGPAWKRQSGWKSSTSPCDWDGVWCEPAYESRGDDVTAHVVGLSLAFNNLQGSLPPTFTNLTELKTLNIMMNKLTGPLPEAILEKWDRNEFELFAWSNRFSNMATSARIEVSASGARCGYLADVRYFIELSENGAAHFESIRCGRRNTEYLLVREGQSPSLMRLTRALTRLGFRHLQSEYSYPFTFVTHQTYVRTTIRFGDDSVKSIETYGGQGPIESWLVEQAVFGLIPQVIWSKEYRKKIAR